MRLNELKQIIQEEVHKILESDVIPVGSEVEKNRSKIGRQVIDNVRKNNPNIEDAEREMIRKMEK